jgi:Cdc6-like AAA superfamily ATPase
MTSADFIAFAARAAAAASPARRAMLIPELALLIAELLKRQEADEDEKPARKPRKASTK